MNYIKENIAEFKLCNIVKWHELGYTGKGIKVANMEKTNPDLWFFDGKVSTPTGHVYDKFENYHGNQTMDCIHQVAPDADLITLSKSAKSSNNYIEGVIIDVSIPYMINNGVHLVNASLGGNNNKMLNDIIVNAQSHGVVFCTSAGNVAEKGLKGYAKSNKWISVGAVHYYDHDKKTKLASYSSRGKELDITCFSNLHIHDARKDYKGRTFPVEGTSFSSPMFTGMLALVQQFFLEKIGRTLYQDEIELFIQDHVVDLGAEGWDEMYGHGLFVLPEPDTIDVEKYLLRDRPTPTPEEPIEENPPIHNNLQEIMSESDYTLFTNYKNIYDGAKKDNNKVAMDYAKQSALALLNKYGIEDNYFNDDEPPTIPEEPTPEPEPPIEEPELPTPDPPIENPNNKIYKVAYCAGHGGNNSTKGKRSPDGEYEWDFNNEVVLAFEKEMKKYDNIQLLRTDDSTGQTDVPLSIRTDLANEWGADIYISFHHNAFEGKWGNHTGTETFYHNGSENGYSLARIVHNKIINAYGLRDRGLKVNNLHITSKTNMPAILVEGGFMDSSIDILKLRDKNILRVAGKEAALGVLEYFNISIIKESNENPIIGLPTATIEQMKEWAKSKKANQLLIDLAPIFYDVSVSVGINPVVTYCQSAKETGYMNFGGVLDATYHNPCGLKNTSGGGDYDPNAHKRFANWEEGITAMVDHLALYSGVEGYPKANTPDPRHFPYLHGTATTVESLGGKWAPSLEYGNSIVRMVKEVENTVVEVEPEPTPKPIEQIELTDIKIKLHDKEIEVEGIFRDGTNYIPIRFLEQMGYDLDWQEGAVIIKYKTEGQA